MTATVIMFTFQDQTDYLKRNGWIERSPISFVKNGYEIFWDTSSVAEIYPENDNTQRLADVRVETLADLEKLVERLTPVDDWATLSDERAFGLIGEILNNISDDLVLNKNTEALERRYGKPAGTVCQMIFHEDVTDPQKILNALKKETRIFL